MDDDLAQRVADLEELIQKLTEPTGDFFGGRGNANNLSLSQYNPFYSRGAGRVINQLPFDESLDSSNAAEFFFQMPAQVRGINAAKVWVQEKPYRTFSSAASTVSGGSISSGAGGGGSTGGPSSTAIAADGGYGTSTHAHSDPQGGVTGTDAAPGFLISISTASYADNVHTHSGSSHSHNVDIGSHTHSLTDSINETSPSGTLSLFLANDGTTYGSAIVSGVTSITGQSLTSQLTGSSGDKRIKIVTTGKTRVQVLLLLDVRVAVL